MCIRDRSQSMAEILLLPVIENNVCGVGILVPLSIFTFASPLSCHSASVCQISSKLDHLRQSYDEWRHLGFLRWRPWHRSSNSKGVAGRFRGVYWRSPPMLKPVLSPNFLVPIESRPKISVFWRKRDQNVKFRFWDPHNAYPCAIGRLLTYYVSKSAQWPCG